MSIRIIVTGGTFDKRYDEVRGELTFAESHLPEILRQARIAVPVTLEINQLVDSLAMTEADRARVVDACRTAPEEQIVIVHGTDTMVETAARIGVQGLAHTIVLTGALIPYTVQGTDSLFNLGFALAACQLLPHGVYIAMNGHIFPWNGVRKNRALGIFENA
jgi:L-asparaginase